MTKRKEPAVGRTAPVAKMINSGRAHKAAAKRAAKNSTSKDLPTDVKKDLDIAPAADVSSPSLNTSPDITSSAPPITQEKTMTLTLIKNTKERKSNAVAYTAVGYNGSVRFSKSFFTDKSGPSTLVLDAEQFAAARQARAKMTAEERKAARAAAPKLTPAEKLAKIEERAAKLRAKIAAASA